MIKMLPSKSIVDYTSEINRIFPRPNESDLYGQYPSPMSGANRSSSSADSTSPESLQELPSSPEERPMPAGLGIVDTPRLQDSTLEQQRRQRPIVGRKIIQTTETKALKYEKPTNYEKEYSTLWQEDRRQSTPPTFLQNTPPKFYIKHTPTVFYELFPIDNRGFEFSQFLTPVKQKKTSPPSLNYVSTNMSPNMINMSPNMTNMSPNMTNMSPNMTNMSPNMTNMSPNMTNMSPNMTNVSPNSYNRSPSQFTPNSYDFNYRRPRFESNASSISSQNWTGTGGSRMQKPDMREKICTFCRKNGERPQVFMTHTVKERVGNKHVVTCPILRSHVCSTCGETGDDAHTITYCPVLRSSNNGAPLESATITLKSTRLKSSGRRRY